MWSTANLKKALSVTDELPEIISTGVSIDSRTIQDGNFFLAIKGPTCDGHAYAWKALKKGASFVVLERPLPDVAIERTIIVPCVKRALEQLAAFSRTHTRAQVCAITGSSGKTTTKEFLAFVLKHFGKTTYSRASYNNSIGVPYSLAQLETDSRFGVFEVGTNSPGEIAPLTLCIRPNIAVITNIGECHIGPMGSMEAIAEEKSEIMRGLSPLGHVILPMDSPFYDQRLLKKAKELNIQHIYTFGKSERAYARLVSFTQHSDGTGGLVEARVGAKTYSYTIQLPGEHSALNSLIVLTVCASMGLPLEEVIQTIPSFTPVQGRGLRRTLLFNNGHITLIDDAYNANPSSMRAGLSTLSSIQTDAKCRRIAVLGDMKELGEKSHEYHKNLASFIEDMNVDLIFAAGEEMHSLYLNLSMHKRGGYAKTAEQILPTIISALQEGDIILVKGSKSSYISKVVDALLSHCVEHG